MLTSVALLLHPLGILARFQQGQYQRVTLLPTTLRLKSFEKHPASLRRLKQLYRLLGTCLGKIQLEMSLGVAQHQSNRPRWLKHHPARHRRSYRLHLRTPLLHSPLSGLWRLFLYHLVPWLLNREKNWNGSSLAGKRSQSLHKTRRWALHLASLLNFIRYEGF
jgi:hypothetical protein